MKQLDCLFKPLAIRVLKPQTGEVSTTIRETVVQSMQKSMSGNESWHYFCHGVEVGDGVVRIPIVSLADRMLYNEQIKICINAIVGKNGAGKSTLIDMAIRLMNNVAACIFGERPRFAAAEHLHFIDYVFAEFLYLRDGVVYRLTNRNRKINLYIYSEVYQENGFYIFKKNEIKRLLDGEAEDITIPLDSVANSQILSKHFFYSVVCNYSFYAYNYRDYAYEQTNKSRINNITVGRGVDKKEDTFWISGLFHKNDGYQTPIVLNPWRKDGNLDVARENTLAMERIVSLLFYYDPINSLYPFRNILDKLTINSIILSEKEKKLFSKDNMVYLLFNPDEEYAQLTCNLNEWLYDLIVDKWKEVFFIGEIGSSPIDQDVQDYAVYKTLKICSNYIAYLDVWEEMKKASADEAKIRKRLGDLGTDRTHITSKLRRACYQLRYKYYQYQNDYDSGMAVDDINIWMQKVITEHKDVEEGCSLTYDDLLPPPIFDFNLGIEDGYGRDVPFTGLSTGERQATYVISNIMYHLVNINSAWRDKGGSYEVRYRYVNIMLDEVELYFHPDLQRRFIDMMLSAIRSVALPNIYGINITIVTHSPFIVSDLPDTNIMYLGRKKGGEKTFGANIYDLLDNTFFMEDNIGELAKKRIGQFISIYNKQLEHWKRDDLMDIERSVDKEAFQEFEQNLYFYRYLNSIIGDIYLSNEMHDMIDELCKFYQVKGIL